MEIMTLLMIYLALTFSIVNNEEKFILRAFVIWVEFTGFLLKMLNVAYIKTLLRFLITNDVSDIAIFLGERHSMLSSMHKAMSSEVLGKLSQTKSM